MISEGLSAYVMFSPGKAEVAGNNIRVLNNMTRAWISCVQFTT